MSLFNKLVVSTLPFIPKPIVGQVSKRYIAGEALTDAVRTVKALNGSKCLATLDLLGEDISAKEEAVTTRENVLQMYPVIVANELDSNVSVKPTQLGLRLNKQLCYENIRTIAEKAELVGNFLRIDMEDATTTEDTLEIYQRLRSEGLKRIGVVIQAYMRRSESDIRSLAKIKANIRLCKGIYNELPSIAIKDRQGIRDNYLKLLRLAFEEGCYVGIATHDDYLIEQSYPLIKQFGLSKEQYEFQMLLGVREEARNVIVAAGDRLRVYVPYGKQWYAYSIRRLKENPAMAGYIAKAMFGLK